MENVTKNVEGSTKGIEVFAATLYKKGSLDRIKEWTIRVIKNTKGTHETTWSGYLGGRLKISSKPTTGDAIGKAKTKVEKKRREGYVNSIEEARTAEVTLSGMQAMWMDLEEFQSQGYRKIIDEKFNGLRGTYHYTTDAIMSKGNKAYDVDFLKLELRTFAHITNLHIIDFELYAPGYKVNEIASMVKNTANPDRHKLRAYIFDALENSKDTTVAYKRKLRLIEHKKEMTKGLVLANSLIFPSNLDVWAFYNATIDKGGEGIIGRDADRPYDWDNKSRRSTVMIKVKPLMTREFLAVGCSFETRFVADPTGSGAGEYKKLIIYTCINEEGTTFSVTPEGDVESRCVPAPTFDENSWYSVEFREYTVNNVPFHGVGKGFRLLEDIDTTSCDTDKE